MFASDTCFLVALPSHRMDNNNNNKANTGATARAAAQSFRTVPLHVSACVGVLLVLCAVV